jgi:hypothetical protein
MIPERTERRILTLLEKDGQTYTGIGRECRVSRQTVRTVQKAGRLRPRGPGKTGNHPALTVRQRAEDAVRDSGRVYRDTNEWPGWLGFELTEREYHELIRIQACMPPERLESRRVQISPSALAYALDISCEDLAIPDSDPVDGWL